MDTTADKSALRRAAFDRRKIAHAGGAGAAEAAAALFLETRLAEGAAIVAGYRPIRTEIDPTPLMRTLGERGMRLAVPVIEGEGMPLAFRAWDPDTPMVKGAFGAAVPATGDWLEPDLLIVPLVAFDADLWRLGYGGGFYDRTLERLRGLRPTRAIGFAYATQECEAVIREPTDQRMDALVTETRVFRP
ncbi:MAG: 5-formyltetrahydrofolate cyclo-ligase [Pseudomonadota bacterium]